MIDACACPPSFRSADAEADLVRDGFTLVPALAGTQCDLLARSYRELAGEPGSEGALEIDYLRADRSVMSDVRNLVLPLITEVIDEHLVGHRMVFATFVTKNPHADSNMFLHEDRSWVDERRYRAGTLWIPLVDTSEAIGNGALEVIPRSHLLGTYWSGAGTPDMIRPYDEWLRQFLLPLTVDAGDAVFYDSRTLHASSMNCTSKPRVALVCGVIPNQAQLLHVTAPGTRRRRLYAVDEAFFVRYGPRVAELAMPNQYQVIEEIVDDATLTPAMLAAWSRTPAPLPRVIVPASARPAQQWAHLTPDSQRVPTSVVVDGAIPLPSCCRLMYGVATACGAEKDVIVSLDPAACFELDPSAAFFGGFMVAVLDAAPVGAGVAVGSAAANLEPGQRFEFDMEPVTVWNEGPGQLRLLIGARSEVVASAPRSVAKVAGRLKRLVTRPAATANRVMQRIHHQAIPTFSRAPRRAAQEFAKLNEP